MTTETQEQVQEQLSVSVSVSERPVGSGRRCSGCGALGVPEGKRLCTDCKVERAVGRQKKTAERAKQVRRQKALEHSPTCQMCQCDLTGEGAQSVQLFRSKAGTFCVKCADERRTQKAVEQAAAARRRKQASETVQRSFHLRLRNQSNRLVVCDVVDKYGLPVVNGDLLEQRIGYGPTVGVVNRYWNFSGIADSLEGGQKVVMTCAVQGFDVIWTFDYDTARDLIRGMKIVQGAPVRSIDGTAIQGVEWYRRKAIGLRELVGTPFEGGRRVDEVKVE